MLSFFKFLNNAQKEFRKRKGRVDCALALWPRFRLCWHAPWKRDATFSSGESEPTVPLAVWRRLRSVWYSAESRYSCVLWHDYFVSSPFRFCTRSAGRTWLKKLTRVISCRAAHSILICNPDVVLSFTIGNYFLSVSYSVCFYVGSISFSPWKFKVLDCCFCKTKARTNNNHNPWNCAQGLTIDFPISTTGSQYNVALSVRRKT